MCDLHDVAARSFLGPNYSAHMFAFIFVRYIYYVDGVSGDNNAMTILTTLISTTNVIREFVTARRDRIAKRNMTGVCIEIQKN